MKLLAISRSIGVAVLMATAVLSAEMLHLTVRSPYFLTDLGTSLLRVLFEYVVCGVVLGAIVGAVVSTVRWQTFAVALIFFIFVSLKILWLDASLLGIPVIAAGFAAFAAALFGSAIWLSARFALPVLLPFIIVVGYTNVCLGIASGWALAGGKLIAFLLSRRTIAICLCGAFGIVVATASQRWAERKQQRRWSALVPSSIIVAQIVGLLVIRRGVTDERHQANASSSAPDVYILSFDAMRSKDVSDFILSHPRSHLASIAGRATSFENVVSDGLSTDYILANNTFGGSGRRDCEGSIPRDLAKRGYFTLMFYGGIGRRFEGSVCYDYYFAGDGDSLSTRFALPALAAFMSPGKETLRAKEIPARALVEKLTQASGSRSPLYVYMHFLELHAPYLPVHRAAESEYMAQIKEFMRTCYTFGCDSNQPATSSLVAVARAGYLETFGEVDNTVGQVIDLANRRGRPYRIVVTADHGELFGEHGGYAHSGGFVPELLDVPFYVLDSQAPALKQRCELMLTSEAFRSVTTTTVYSDHELLQWAAVPLGRASIDKQQAILSYDIAEEMQQHAGTWRNIHKDSHGSMPYPVGRCN